MSDLPPRRLPPRRKPPAQESPVASYECLCGFRDEVKKPAPDRLNCPECKGKGSLRRYVPRYAPPPIAGRALRPDELD